MNSGLTTLPADLPVPQHDGAVAHLTGLHLPDLTVPATDGAQVNLARLDRQLPDGWDEIPGARGRTPQPCSFRDHYAELQALNTGVHGFSAKSTDDQQEARERLHRPLQLLSDEGLKLKGALGLPTFEVEGVELWAPRKTSAPLRLVKLRCP
ncbi:MAG TPA: redoxin domain-containing protein, partial [Azoarcus taiwanensis]|nr:redoxin domain-containing protein [Azoarcus taiwanensis]